MGTTCAVVQSTARRLGAEPAIQLANAVTARPRSHVLYCLLSRRMPEKPRAVAETAGVISKYMATGSWQHTQRRDARVAEGGALLRRYTA